MKAFSVYGRDNKEPQRLRKLAVDATSYKYAVQDARVWNIQNKLLREPILVVIEASKAS